MSKHVEITGSWAEACDIALTGGGQLYSGGDKNGPWTIVRGGLVTTVWPVNSPKKQKLIEACEIFGIEPYAMTGGRLCRKIIKEVIGLPYKGTRYCDKWRGIAKGGAHWHCTKIVPGVHGICYEFDIKSAYMVHYLKNETALLRSDGRYRPDAGFMDNLREIYVLMPKWLRLQLLGVMASHSRTFMERKRTANGLVLDCKTVNAIEFGEAFNCVHSSILATYKTLSRVLELAGDYCVRAHTDSFTLKEETPADVQERIWEYLESREVEVSLKGIGRATFYDLNTGYIGLRFVGDKFAVVEDMRVHGHKISLEQTEVEVIALLDRLMIDPSLMDLRKPNVSLTYEQLELFSRK